MSVYVNTVSLEQCTPFCASLTVTILSMYISTHTAWQVAMDLVLTSKSPVELCACMVQSDTESCTHA
jgi:hypothetical protein